jgi:Domain of unknown function (DUF4349)
MTRLRFLPTLLVLALVGCGSESLPQETRSLAAAGRTFAKSEAPARAAPAPPASGSQMMGRDGMMSGGMMGSMAGMMGMREMAASPDGAQPLAPPTSVVPPAISRKIIYDAQVDLVVDSVDPVAKKVGAFVQEARGYIAEQNVTGSPGSLRSMRWRIRVPVEQFDSLVESIVSLGELERNNRTSQDVSEQYYDIEARIKNKKVEEQTLNKILQERSGKLEDVLKIEIELSRVRGEIEQLEGKIRVLENLSSLATLTLNIRERDKYTPPPPAVADFSTQIARTWDSSMKSLVDLGKSIVLWTVSWAIWIPFWLVGGLLAWIALRLLIRSFLRNLPRLVALARTPIIPPRTRPASEGAEPSRST